MGGHWYEILQNDENGERICYSIFLNMPGPEYIDFFQTYNEILVHRYGNNHGAPCHNSIKYIRRMHYVNRVVFLQAMHYVCVLIKNSDIRHTYNASACCYYFTVALRLALLELQPGVVTCEQLAYLSGISVDLLRNGEMNIRRVLGRRVKPDMSKISSFCKHMVFETCREGENGRWEGHERIRRIRELLLSHFESREPTSPRSETDESGPFQV